MMNTVNGLSDSSYEWNIEKIITREKTSTNFVLVILNTPILLPLGYFNSIWNKAKFRLAVDGGSNRLFDITQNQHIGDADNYIPDVISGDFDSITNEVFYYYKEHGAKMISTSNQDETDFFKALKIIVRECPQISTVVVLCEFQGRFDHAAANLNTLHKVVKHPKMEHLKVYILNPTGIMWLLKPGKHKIDIPKHLWHKNAICSLLPIGNPCHNVTTTGLKWNLENRTLEFGGMVSSSNTYDITKSKPVVTVTVYSHLLWYMSLQLERKQINDTSDCESFTGC